jgi:hypothetical protein
MKHNENSIFEITDIKRSDFINKIDTLDHTKIKADLAPLFSSAQDIPTLALKNPQLSLSPNYFFQSLLSVKAILSGTVILLCTITFHLFHSSNFNVPEQNSIADSKIEAVPQKITPSYSIVKKHFELGKLTETKSNNQHSFLQKNTESSTQNITLFNRQNEIKQDLHIENDDTLNDSHRQHSEELRLFQKASDLFDTKKYLQAEIFFSQYLDRYTQGILREEALLYLFDIALHKHFAKDTIIYGLQLLKENPDHPRIEHILIEIFKASSRTSRCTEIKIQLKKIVSDSMIDIIFNCE